MLFKYIWLWPNQNWPLEALNINSLDTNTFDFIQASSLTMNGNVSWLSVPFFPQIQGGNSTVGSYVGQQASI